MSSPLPAGRAPLVLALHWYDPGADDPVDDYVRMLVEPALRDLDAIVVAPESLHAKWTGEDIARSLKSLVRSATEAWPVDPARVVVTGYSMGGIGAWYMAALYPQLFSAAIPMAGEPAGVLEPRVPLLAIHGELDAMFPLAVTREAVEELVSRGGDARLIVVEGANHHQAAAYLPGLAEAAAWLADEVWAAR